MDTLQRGDNQYSGDGADRDTMYLLGGVALVVFGAGLILSSPATRRLLGQVGLSDLTRAVIPDLEKYMKLRSM